MPQTEVVMPKMGESIIEATILSWTKEEGDHVDLDETIAEIATDKVDSEIPSPVEGILVKKLYEADAVVPVGTPIAIIDTEDNGDGQSRDSKPDIVAEEEAEELVERQPQKKKSESGDSSFKKEQPGRTFKEARPSKAKRFYSPLVRNIAEAENISIDELDSINGTGAGGRVTKKDILEYLEEREEKPAAQETPKREPTKAKHAPAPVAPSVSAGSEDEIVEMDRMRKMIAEHMVRSKKTSPHVTSFVEADVTDIVNWRQAHKQEFQNTYGEKITYTPIFIEAVVRAIRDFPEINISVDDDKIIKKRNINIGMAAALPSGNLIVPVIKNADRYNLAGLTAHVNDLANRARENKLKPEEIQDGTFTVTNVGTFGNVMGTPIINQPQVAILALGAIRKKPAVVETQYGDLIAVRQLMFLSLSYDHRVVDGILGGSFVKRVAEYLEGFDPEREI